MVTDIEAARTSKNSTRETPAERIKLKLRCINWRKAGHRTIDPATDKTIPVQQFQGYNLCVDCYEEIKINRWFYPAAVFMAEHNIEQLQDEPGAILDAGQTFATDLAKFDLYKVGVPKRPPIYCTTDSPSQQDQEEEENKDNNKDSM